MMLDDIVDVIINVVTVVFAVITIIFAIIIHSIYSLFLLLLLLFAMKYLPAVVYHLYVDHHLHTMLIIIVLNNILIVWFHGFDERI